MLSLAINRHSVSPIYYQIQQRLLEQIQTGARKAGDPIPSKIEVYACRGWCHLEWGSTRAAGHSRPALREESTPTTAHFRRFAEWIPAFAGMTAASNAHVSQMTPVPACRGALHKV
ncbi:MAG: hypothetical protein ABSH01_12540 [Terriglobia bacterium]|jgi:hypothetical protein